MVEPPSFYTPGDKVLVMGTPGVILAHDQHDKHRPFLVHLKGHGAIWTGATSFGKGRYGDWGEGFTPGTTSEGKKERTSFKMDDPGATAYKDSLAHDTQAGTFDPQVVRSHVDTANQNEWGDVDKYFEGLNPQQMLRQKFDPHFIILGSILNQQRPADKAWKWPHEAEQGGYSIYTQTEQKKRKKQGLPDELAKPMDISLPGLRQMSRDDLAMSIQHTGGFNFDLADRIKGYAQYMHDNYDDNVHNLWADDPDYDTLVDRFAQIPGVSDYKKGPMMADVARRMGWVTGKNWAPERTRPILDAHAIRAYSRMMTDDPEKQYFLQSHTSGSDLDAIPYIVNFTRALTHDATHSHAPIWAMARHYCDPSNPNCSECPAGEFCPTGGARTGRINVHGFSDENIPREPIPGNLPKNSSFKQVTPNKLVIRPRNIL